MTPPSSHWTRDLDQLAPWGLSDQFRRQFVELAGPEERAVAGTMPRAPGRIVLELRGELTVVTASGERVARIPGRLRHRAEDPEGLPAIGDWVVLAERTGDGYDRIESILQRSSRIVRKTPGEKTEQQVVAANVDTVFIVMGLDGDFNPRRLERFLLTVRDGGAAPVVVLSKRDLKENHASLTEDAARAAAGAPVHAISNKTHEGIDALQPYLQIGVTLALMGSSGVGKSSLVNTLSGAEVMPTGDVRASDDRGKHTTSHRQLLKLPSGALLIDNPGIREIQLWVSEESIAKTFPKIAELVRQCRFNDCTHEREPGCAIRSALESGEIEADRFASYSTLRREHEELEARQKAKRTPRRRPKRRRR